VSRREGCFTDREQFPEADVLNWQAELKEIESTLVDGRFPVTDDSKPEDQDIVVALLRRCLLWADLVLEKYQPLVASIRP
jgi:hypothetical protein